jgi:hypothetical protein
MSLCVTLRQNWLCCLSRTVNVGGLCVHWLLWLTTVSVGGLCALVVVVSCVMLSS